jgi:hypothetical protein
MALLNSKIGDEKPKRCVGILDLSTSNPIHKKERFLLISEISLLVFIRIILNLNQP